MLNLHHNQIKIKMLKKFLFLSVLGLSLVSCKNETAKTEDVVEATASEVTAPAMDVATDPNAALTNPTTDPAVAAAPTGPTTKVTFDEMEYNFGDVKDGEKVTHYFSFKNTGNEPLVISNAVGSCGCTVPEWPKEAIAPGKSGKIKVVFDSKGKGSPEGSKQSKTVDITANTDPATTNLRIFGTVKGEAAPAN